MPFQAGVAGQPIPRARFVRGEDVNLSSDAIYEKYGPVNGQIANAVIQRSRQTEGSNSDGFGMRTETGGAGNGGTRRPTAVAAFSPGPDPWTTPPATGNGITQEISKRSATAPQAALPYGLESNGAKQGPRPGANFSDPRIKADGPNDQPQRERYIDSIVGGVRNAPKNFRRARPAYQAAAATGAALLGAVGLDALVIDETERRQGGQY
jgi:hypothetical protein